MKKISQLTKTEIALRESEQKFRLTFEHAKDAIFWADSRTGKLINCNKAAQALLERKKNEIIGQRQTFLHPPEKHKEYAKMFRDHAKQKSAADIFAEVITKSKKIHWKYIGESMTDRPDEQKLLEMAKEAKSED